jgi:ribonuclease P protein component
MLAAAQRLRRREEFAATIRSGRRVGRGGVVVHLSSAPAQVDPQVSPRAGFVVSKSVGGAVVRNKVRRRLRQLTRERLDRLDRGTDLVVRALPEAATRSYAQLGTDLDAALSAARSARSAARSARSKVMR